MLPRSRCRDERDLGTVTPLAPASLTERRSSSEPQGAILCAHCRAALTEIRARLDVGGAHVHTFINPAGIIFTVRCFAPVPGVLGIGEASTHWSWFLGFAWQTAVCNRCLEHVGWRFEGLGTPFGALIAERVLEELPPS